MANQHEWRLLVSLFHQRVQLPHDLSHGARVGAEIAPATSGSVVRADVRERCDQRLNESPINRECANTSLEDHGRLAGDGAASAVEMEPPTADIDQPARRWVWCVGALTSHRAHIRQ